MSCLGFSCGISFMPTFADFDETVATLEEASASDRIAMERGRGDADESAASHRHEDEDSSSRPWASTARSEQSRSYTTVLCSHNCAAADGDLADDVGIDEDDDEEEGPIIGFARDIAPPPANPPP